MMIQTDINVSLETAHKVWNKYYKHSDLDKRALAFTMREFLIRNNENFGTHPIYGGPFNLSDPIWNV